MSTTTNSKDLFYFVEDKTEEQRTFPALFSTFDRAMKAAVASVVSLRSFDSKLTISCSMDKETYKDAYNDLSTIATVSYATCPEQKAEKVLVTYVKTDNFAGESVLSFFSRVCVELGFYVSGAETRDGEVTVSLTRKLTDVFQTDPGYLFYVNMVKRRDGTVVNDLSKTDGIIYHTPEEAQAAIDKDPETSNSRRVVEMVAKLTTLED